MREVLGGKLAPSEGDDHDLIDTQGRKWEGRSVSGGGIYFCPSYMVGSGRRFDCDEDFEDVYGRRLAYVTLETGEFVNARLVRDGLARVSARRRLRRWDELRQAEADARMRRRGMWGERPRVPPDSYRLRRGG